MEEVRGRAGRLAVANFLHFLAIGVILPYLPAYFSSTGLTATQVGLLLAMQPAFSLVAPALVARLADRTGHAGRLYSVMATGAVAGFAPLLWVTGFPAVAVAFGVYALFASSLTTLLDTLALAHVAKVGGSYARLRLFGSAGFVVSSAAFGWMLSGYGQATVVVPLTVMTAGMLWSFRLHEGDRPVPPPAHGVFALDRELVLLLAASAVHWIASAPFHGMFAIHVEAIGLPASVVGTAASLGVVAEIAFMFVFPRLEARFEPRRILAVAFVLSAVRWAVMASTDSAVVIVAIALLHGFSFGAFLVATIAAIARRVPAEHRAAGQAMFVSATFGIGGLAGFLLAGRGYDLLGGHRLFAWAAALELVPLGLVLLLRPVALPLSQRAP